MVKSFFHHKKTDLLEPAFRLLSDCIANTCYMTSCTWHTYLWIYCGNNMCNVWNVITSYMYLSISCIWHSTQFIWQKYEYTSICLAIVHLSIEFNWRNPPAFHLIKDTCSLCLNKTLELYLFCDRFSTSPLICIKSKACQ